MADFKNRGLSRSLPPLRLCPELPPPPPLGLGLTLVPVSSRFVRWTFPPNCALSSAPDACGSMLSSRRVPLHMPSAVALHIVLAQFPSIRYLDRATTGFTPPRPPPAVASIRHPDIFRVFAG